MSFLEKIKPDIQEQVEERKETLPLETIKSSVTPGDHAFRKHLSEPSGISLIAEFKKRSPSAGEINETASLSDYIPTYDRYASAISILTEQHHFGGHPELLEQAGAYTKQPLLRKDFVIDEHQIYEARYFGADAVLLIAGMLDDDTLDRFLQLTEDLGMDALVECHTPEGLERILQSSARIIGINNRDLDTLETDPERSARLLRKIPEADRSSRVLVAESALRGRQDVERLPDAFDAVLVGSAIMSFPHPELKLKEFTGETLVKFCGITSVEDAEESIRMGADLIGLNFYPESPRYLGLNQAEQIAAAVGTQTALAGVFVNPDRESLNQVLNRVDLDLLQFSGDETPEEIESFRSFGLPVIKALHIEDQDTLQQSENYKVDYLMVDAHVEGAYGGTGEQIDPDHLQNNLLNDQNLIIAGGLAPENVGEVVNRFQPVMVDVCSGIENKPGVKDSLAMASFIDAVKR